MAKAHTPHAAKYLRPRLAKHVLERPDIARKLREAFNYPLTLVRAGAGYGKTTLINQAFPETSTDTLWFNCSEEDSSPAAFLLHIIYAILGRFPAVGEKSLHMLTWDDRQGNDPFAALAALAEELNQNLVRETVLIFDDFQHVGQYQDVLRLLDEFLDLLPNHVHVIIASREKTPLPQLAIKRAKNLVLDIQEEDLAFKKPEIQELFQKYYSLPVDDRLAGQLAARTEGWIMAIHMLAQLMRKGQSWETAWGSLPQSMTELFEFLLQDYLAKQPEAIRCFLRYTAYLDILKGEDCDHILAVEGSAAVLRGLETRGMFTFHIGDGLYRYHQLFQEYLRKTSGLTRSQLNAFHHKAAMYYRQQDDQRQAVGHLLSGGYFDEAAGLMQGLGQDMMANGRHGELRKWLNALPADRLFRFPELVLCQGDMHRLAGDFATALTLYAAAEKSFAAAGSIVGKYQVAKAIALVYLDSVQPAPAEKYLMEALELVDKSGVQEKARLYQLLAENNVNLGRSEEAAAFFRQANELFLEDSRGDVEARLHLRTGRLYTAKRILLSQAERRNPYQLPRSHRETPLLLSLVNAFMGDIDEAWANAQEGLNIGSRLKAVFVQAVAYMRLGHAKQLKSWTDMDEAVECYQQALDIVSELGVERGKAEALFGLCLLYGHHGKVETALRYGMEGLRVGKAAKDDWMSAMIELAVTIAYYKANDYLQAREWADRSLVSFTRCGDSYLSAAAMLWQAMVTLAADERVAFRKVMEGLLTRTQTGDFDFLFSKPTLLGLRDTQEAIPLLRAAEKETACHSYAVSLLAELGNSPELANHPGYTLRVQTFGQFRVWRGMEEIRAKEWQREKAKRLFQYFIANRKQLLHKEQLIEALWGEAGSDSDFKVALNALINALEPSRSARATPFYIIKQSSSYGLNLAAGILLDVDEFESYITRGNRIVGKDSEQAIRLYRTALNQYKGDFLPECCYEDWCQEERERLLMLYITAAEHMSLMLYERGELEECITLCMRILGKDCCWESAYRLLMQCYYRQNNRAMVIRVYRQCRDNLKAELGVTPAPETVELYKKLANGDNL